MGGDRPQPHRSAIRAFLIIAGLAVSLLLLGAGAAPALAGDGALTLRRNAAPTAIKFTAPDTGEGLLDLTAWAPGVAWEKPGAESAVVSLWVDGAYTSDLVVFSSEPLTRRLALGHLEAGPHTLSARLAGDRSPPGARLAKLKDVAVSAVPPGDAEYTALRHAPVLYGRRLPSLGSPFQNATTDTPLLAWHETQPASIPGHSVIEYSIIWSNEDGGTDTPALMARWGRTTDIEWVYRLEVDEVGDRVPGSAVYQGPGHLTLPFAGAFEGDHPRLQTCTSNNMVCAFANDPMRFFLAADATRPTDRARELLMDENGWTYQVMAAEMLREGKVEPLPDPATPEMSDQRNYLYVELDKDTLPPNPQIGPWVGVAIGVRLAGDPTVYRSDHGIVDWSVQRDSPAAVTVELPLGTTAGDVVQIIAYRVVVGFETLRQVEVTDLNRAFLLSDSYLPQPSFVEFHGSATLGPFKPSAVLWSR
ncbi:MAG TPA: hypothetical protein VFT91_06730 [Dehalococcoidia bacterium]|nr:hypothetical protein [Dehalococcoidia bacterium]